MKAGLRTVALAFLVLTAAAPGALHGQSIIGGEVEGTVTDRLDRPIRGAVVRLQTPDDGIGRREVTRGDGSYSFPYVPGGSYVVRAEALGYRPIVYVGVELGPGDRLRIPIDMTVEPPPVTRVDTVRWAGAGAGPGGGAHAGRKALSGLPDRDRSVADILAISSRSDPVGGIEGLPQRFTTVYAEGEPFRSAGHPVLGATGEGSGSVFPRVALQSATVRTGIEDIEWSSLGGVVSLETRSPMASDGGELFGLWSGGQLWNNEVVGDGPDLLSLWGGGSATFPIRPDTSAVSVFFEGGTLETPNLFWRDDFFGRRVLDSLAVPGLRTTEYGSGLARVEWLLEDGGRVTARAGLSTFRQESDRPGGPRLAYGSDLPGEGSDASVLGVVALPLSESMLLEVRGAVGISTRSWKASGDSLAGAWLVRDRALLGTDPSFPAESERVDISLNPVVHFQRGVNRFKAGARAEFSSFDITHADQAAGAFFFGSRQALQAFRGAAIGLSGATPRTDFSVSRVSLFGQYRWMVLPELDLTTAASFEVERLPITDIEPATEWTAISAVPNIPLDTRINEVDGRVHLRWNPDGNGRTWLAGGAGVEHGSFDPFSLHEVLALDDETVEIRRAVGDGLDWRAGSIPATAGVSGARLALFGGELALPQTTRGAAGFFVNLPAGTRLGLSGVFRRTESILRPTDLNGLEVAAGTDQNGRPVFGELEAVGGALAAKPGSDRRFPNFESVWSLDPDGWSEYTGITVSVDAPLASDGSLSLRYTWSETRDNLVGASRGTRLARLAPELPVAEWDEGVSDFDVPHRVSALAVVPLPLPWGGTVTGLYNLRSARPFTPMVATGLDANGDGSPFNDPAFVPDDDAVASLASEWECLSEALGGFPDRNSCRPDVLHSLDVRLSVGLPDVMGVPGALVVDGLNLTDTDVGIRDDNLLLLGNGPVRRSGEEFQVPYRVNPGFGGWLFRGDAGRMLRIGVRIGGGS